MCTTICKCVLLWVIKSQFYFNGAIMMYINLCFKMAIIVNASKKVINELHDK